VKISEAFGPVKAPRYIVRLVEGLPDLVLIPNTILYYATDRVSYLFTKTLHGIKGSDASNIYDEEVNDDVALY
jgi:H/ACA ribonucleoprotein complex non-core subunit NAF1